MALYLDEAGAPKVAPRRPGETGARRVRARALAAMVVALVAGLLAAVLIVRTLRHRPTLVREAPMQRVVVAARDIVPATTITADMLATIDWPVTAKLPGMETDTAALVGRVTTGSVVKGEPVLEPRLATKGSGEGLSAVIPSEMRAMTVHVTDVSGVSGFIHPGDLVDVIATMQAQAYGGHSDWQDFHSKVVLQAVRVLAVGEDIVATTARPMKVSVVTLLVTPEDSEKLALAQSHGELMLSMRSQADNWNVATPGIAPPELLGLEAAPVREHPATGAAVARKPSPAPSPTPAAAPAVAPQKGDVVEILRGDKFEERQLRGKAQ